MLITKVLVGAAVALGVAGSVPAGADPGASDPHTNPFGSLGCSCQEADLTGSHGPSVEIDRGITAGAHGGDTRTVPLPE